MFDSKDFILVLMVGFFNIITLLLIYLILKALGC